MERHLRHTEALRKLTHGLHQHAAVTRKPLAPVMQQQASTLEVPRSISMNPKAKSWKTTLASILGGLLVALGPQVGARLQGDHEAPPITFGNIATAAALVALGSQSKDKDVTGGSREQ